jgi:hypothetical protein
VFAVPLTLRTHINVSRIHRKRRHGAPEVTCSIKASLEYERLARFLRASWRLSRA